MKKKKRYKFLSESILLEETGIPGMNVLIAVSVSLLIVLFVVWGNNIFMTESIKFSGQLTEAAQNNVYVVTSIIDPNDINLVHEKDAVLITINGVTAREKLVGTISDIDYDLKKSGNDRYYYQAEIEFNQSELNRIDQNDTIIMGANVSMEVIIGEQSFIQYLLGNLYESGKNALNFEK